MWLSKDIRNFSPTTVGDAPVTAQSAFTKTLEQLGGSRRPVYVSVNASSMLHSACPGMPSAASSSIGFSAEEVLDMALIAGTDSNVSTSHFYSYF